MKTPYKGLKKNTNSNTNSQKSTINLSPKKISKVERGTVSHFKIQFNKESYSGISFTLSRYNTPAHESIKQDNNINYITLPNLDMMSAVYHFRKSIYLDKSIAASDTHESIEDGANYFKFVDSISKINNKHMLNYDINNSQKKYDNVNFEIESYYDPEYKDIDISKFILSKQLLDKDFSKFGKDKESMFLNTYRKTKSYSDVFEKNGLTISMSENSYFIKNFYNSNVNIFAKPDCIVKDKNNKTVGFIEYKSRTGAPHSYDSIFYKDIMQTSMYSQITVKNIISGLSVQSSECHKQTLKILDDLDNNDEITVYEDIPKCWIIQEYGNGLFITTELTTEIMDSALNAVRNDIDRIKRFVCKTDNISNSDFSHIYEDASYNCNLSAYKTYLTNFVENNNIYREFIKTLNNKQESFSCESEWSKYIKNCTNLLNNSSIEIPTFKKQDSITDSYTEPSDQESNVNNVLNNHNNIVQVPVLQETSSLDESSSEGAGYTINPVTNKRTANKQLYSKNIHVKKTRHNPVTNSSSAYTTSNKYNKNNNHQNNSYQNNNSNNQNNNSNNCKQFKKQNNYQNKSCIIKPNTTYSTSPLISANIDYANFNHTARQPVPVQITETPVRPVNTNNNNKPLLNAPKKQRISKKSIDLNNCAFSLNEDNDFPINGYELKRLNSNDFVRLGDDTFAQFKTSDSDQSEDDTIVPQVKNPFLTISPSPFKTGGSDQLKNGTQMPSYLSSIPPQKYSNSTDSDYLSSIPPLKNFYSPTLIPKELFCQVPEDSLYRDPKYLSLSKDVVLKNTHKKNY
jgi:hypothetical protein